MNAQSPHKWLSTFKSAVFGLSSSLPPCVLGGGGLVCESVGKADLLSDNFDGKQSRKSADLDLPLRRLSYYTWTLLEAPTRWVCFLLF